MTFVVERAEKPKVVGPKPVLAPYESPRVEPPKRGEHMGKTHWSDLEFLKAILDMSQVEDKTVSPHPSVLHKKHSQLLEVIEAAHAGGCDEAAWGKDMLRCCEGIEHRRIVAGGLSVVQMRGTGHYWSKLHLQVKRRIAEKALCALRRMKECRKGSSSRARALELLAATVALDPAVTEHFMSNGFDAKRMMFVMEPEAQAAERALAALGAPLGGMPLLIHPRGRGIRLGLDGSNV